MVAAFTMSMLGCIADGEPHLQAFQEVCPLCIEVGDDMQMTASRLAAPPHLHALDAHLFSCMQDLDETDRYFFPCPCGWVPLVAEGRREHDL